MRILYGSSAYSESISGITHTRACHWKCREDANCKHFAYDKAGDTCWKLGDLTSQVANVQFNSGEPWCETSECDHFSVGSLSYKARVTKQAVSKPKFQLKYSYHTAHYLLLLFIKFLIQAVSSC